MKVELLNTGIINNIKIRKLSYFAQNSICLQNDRFSRETIDVLAKITRVYSKEDLERIDAFKEKFSRKNNLPELKQKYFTDYSSNILKLDKTPSKSLIKKIREDSLKLYSINSLMGDVPQVQYSRFFDCDFGVQSLKLVDKFYSHPVDLAINLCGTYSKEDYMRIENLKKKFLKIPFKDILLQKFEILDKLSQKLDSPKADFMGYFSNKDLDYMKNLCIVYEAFNGKQLSLVSNNTSESLEEISHPNTKALETLLYSKPITDLKKGDYIQGKGLVIDKLMIGDKPVVLLYSMDARTHAIRMYDLNKIIHNIDDVSKEQVLNSDFETLMKENNHVKNYLDDLNNSAIAQINFKIVDFKKHIKPSGHVFSDTIENSKEAYFITNFVNYNPKVYKNAGLVLGIKLLKILSEQKSAPLFLTALEFNNKQKSPYILYKRLGFEPYSHTNEQIEEIAKENRGKIPSNVDIKMYLESLEPLKSRILELENSYLKAIP